ncbi:MAG: hypothetical protein Q4E39_05380 [bacterium]|nr:hypothetical protein [bacterium]
MENYEFILNEVNSYINRKQNISEGQISLYDLYRKTEKYLSPLTDIFENNIIEKRLNKSVSLKERIERAKNDKIGDKYTVVTYTENQKAILKICIDGWSNFLKIIKDFNDDNLYAEYYNYGSLMKSGLKEEVIKIIKPILKKNYKEIVEQLNILEQYSKRIGDIDTKKDNFCCNASNDLFDITVICTSYSVGYNIKLSKEYDENGIYDRTWLSRPSLEDVVNENISDILKNTFVNVRDLDERFKIILNDYELLEENEKLTSDSKDASSKVKVKKSKLVK